MSSECTQLKKLSWLSTRGYEALLNHLQDGIFVVEEGKLTYVNPRLADMLGYPVDDLIGRHFTEIVCADDRPIAMERHYARLDGAKVPQTYDIRLLTSQGQAIFCSFNVGLSETTAGSTVTVGSIRDVTQQKATLEALEKSREDFKSIFDKLPDVIYRADMHGIITKISPSCFNLLGYPSEEMLGTALVDYYCDPTERPALVQAIIDGGGKATQIEARLKHKNGAVIWVSSNVSLRCNPDGEPAYIEGVSRNISKRKQLEEELTVLSRTDALTGAYNRRCYMDKTEEVIHMIKRYQRPASMMILDLDHFKTINDNYGHQAGDLALKAFANLCRQEIRESDLFGRLGGEEFGLILPETPIQFAQNLAERIREAVAALRIRVGHQAIRVTVSIGLTEFGPDETSVDAVIHRADLAMYQAKLGGRNRVVTAA
jgi:diguanylate cyclase (GGDEF)-like protein/PAS domain S-box-containing protein